MNNEKKNINGAYYKSAERKNMEFANLLKIKNRIEFRKWLEKNHNTEKECWLIVKKGRQQDGDVLSYLDSVEEALCFGWIDSVHRTIAGFGHAQRFSPRAAKSPWTELNKERCRRLEAIGKMTAAGYAVLPDMTETGFSIDDDIMGLLKADEKTWNNFNSFPPLYQRVRINTIQRERNKPEIYQRTLQKFLENTKYGIMYGEWNDGGRLLAY
jgi:hypothetical protein